MLLIFVFRITYIENTLYSPLPLPSSALDSVEPSILSETPSEPAFLKAINYKKTHKHIPLYPVNIYRGEMKTASTSAYKDDNYVAICLASHQQEVDMPEWAWHHYYNLDIRRFYIMDDASSPPYDPSKFGVPIDAIDYHYYPKEEHITAM